jgi:hypothetical protein
MADQDHDGSHIKGLVINFFGHFWSVALWLCGSDTVLIALCGRHSARDVLQAFFVCFLRVLGRKNIVIYIYIYLYTLLYVLQAVPCSVYLVRCCSGGWFE